MGIVEIVIGIAVIIGVAGLSWLFMNADNSEYDTETDSVEDSPSTVIPPPSRSTSAVTPASSGYKSVPKPTNYEFISSLPTIYYLLAIFCGVVLLIGTLVYAGDLSGAEIGGLIGYTVGAVLSMFAVGRVIELLQQIRDAVRNIPALSPSRPDDE